MAVSWSDYLLVHIHIRGSRADGSAQQVGGNKEARKLPSPLEPEKSQVEITVMHVHLEARGRMGVLS
jgi:hypothetical protein